MNVNLLIVGGCFTVQNNIAKENLYHQLVKRELEENSGCRIGIEIIRYERFKSCYEKIEKYVNKNKIDALLFHIRTEQFLRLSKLYYKYCNAENKIKKTLTISFLNRIPPESHDLLRMNMPLPSENKERQRMINRIKIFLNYSMGILAGNRNYALKKYEELVLKVSELCEDKNIKLILAGPASRPHLKSENYLAEFLNSYFMKLAAEKKIPFMNLTGIKNENNEELFFENGIHVNEAGHRRAAGLLAKKLAEVISIL